MVELRKRPPPKEPAAPPPAAKRSNSKVKELVNTANEAVTSATTSAAPAASRSRGRPKKVTAAAPAAVDDDDDAEVASSSAVAGELMDVGTPAAAAVTDEPTTNTAMEEVQKVEKLDESSIGKSVSVEGFGGTVQTHDGTDVTFKELLEKNPGGGLVIFTYPKASTPGCTNQACFFRDSYAPITGASLAVYGLSADSPKSNTIFATKQKLPYKLLCDPNATLLAAIGMKKAGPAKSAQRGVVVIDSQGIVRVWEQSGPQKTLDAVLNYIKSAGMTETGGSTGVAPVPPADPAASEEAAKLADPYTADPDTKMDEFPLIREASKEEEQAAETAAEVADTAQKIDATKI